MAGRPRTPTTLLEMKGAFRKNPQRAKARAGEPEVTDPLGHPPDCFLIEPPEIGAFEAARLLAIWYEIVAQVPPGVLTSADRAHVETTCRLMLQSRRPGAKTGVFAQLNKYLAQMGCNPSDRSRVSVTKAKPGPHASPLAQMAEQACTARRA